MSGSLRRGALAGALAWMLTAAVACAGEEPPAPQPGPIPCRGPYVLPVARWARPSNTGAYDGGYVGGGCACAGEARAPHEGTWGWDYIGCCFSRRVFLNWYHCGRYQGGIGAYEANGPSLPELPKLRKHED
jgi:hypothetical protein